MAIKSAFLIVKASDDTNAEGRKLPIQYLVTGSKHGMHLYGGKLEAGEDPYKGLLRELNEEVIQDDYFRSIIAKIPRKPSFIGAAGTVKSGTQILDRAASYYVVDAPKGEVNNSLRELNNYRSSWVTPDQLDPKGSLAVQDLRDWDKSGGKTLSGAIIFGSSTSGKTYAQKQGLSVDLESKNFPNYDALMTKAKELKSQGKVVTVGRPDKLKTADWSEIDHIVLTDHKTYPVELIATRMPGFTKHTDEDKIRKQLKEQNEKLQKIGKKHNIPVSFKRISEVIEGETSANKQ